MELENEILTYLLTQRKLIFKSEGAKNIAVENRGSKYNTLASKLRVVLKFLMY